MEYSSSYTSSSLCSSFSSYPKEEKRSKSSSSFLSSLHAVDRKHSAKPMKKPIAPLPKTPPKIYKVEPKDFKIVVQRLTGGRDQLQIRRLQEVAPPALDLSPAMLPQNGGIFLQAQFPDANNAQTHANFGSLTLETSLENQTSKLSDSFGAFSPLAFTLSPSSQTWFSSLIWSPTTPSSLKQSQMFSSF